MKTDNEIFESFKSKNVFGRGVIYPIYKNPFSIYNETFAETELRKVSREFNRPTATKDKSNKRGNPNRSVVLMTKNSSLFTNVGYGIINPDISDISRVSFCEYGTGEGKKSDIYEFFQRPQEISDNLSSIKKTFDTSSFNGEITEILLNIYNCDKISFIYVNSDDNHNLISNEKTDILKNFLQSIYLKNKFSEILKRDLPIYMYSSSGSFKNASDNIIDSINNIFEGIYYKDSLFFVEPENINYINQFSNILINHRLKNNIQNSLNTTYDVYMQCNPQDFNKYYSYINLSKALKKFGLVEQSYLLLDKCLDSVQNNVHYLQSDLISSFNALCETKNEDFRLVRSLHKQSYNFDFINSDIPKVSSYLYRFSNEINKDSLKLLEDAKNPKMLNKVTHTKSIVEKSVKLLASKAVKFI